MPSGPSLAYLSRSAHRVAVPNSRLIAIDERGVSFKWRAYRVKEGAKGQTRHKAITLAPADFMRRFLSHVPPRALTYRRISLKDPSHNRVYSAVQCYDVAFNFRDIGAECDALAHLAERHGNGAPRTMLELAAGPARHAREWARRGVVATALDSSTAMCEYARACAARDGVPLQAVVADMVDFFLGTRFDLAVMPMDSSSYLLDNAAALSHFDCVARHLVDGGLYVLEMTHPRSAFGVGPSTGTDWISEAEGLREHTCWGAAGDAFDPITQIDEVTVTMTWSGPAGEGRVQERARQRRFTANEVDALVRASGQFEIVEWLGSLAEATAFSNDPKASFMVQVLRKKPTARC